MNNADTGVLRLVMPSMAYLSGFQAALERGWSPNTLMDVSRELLEKIAAGSEKFMEEFNAPHHGRTIRQADGREVPRLPALTLWLWDGEFCGSINLRYVEGTNDLPEYVSGHIGYTVVPWKRGKGYATDALRQLLPEAWARGLTEVQLTCDEDNVPSQKVILANQGRFVRTLQRDSGKYVNLYTIKA